MTTESKIDNATLTLGEQDFSCQPTSVIIGSVYADDGEPISVVCGTSLAADTTVSRVLRITTIQDFTDPAGLMRYLRVNELGTVPFVWTASPEAETCTGQVQCRLGDWGGEAKKRLTSDLELPVIGDLAWGDPIAPTGATAGIPGTFTPPGAYTPLNLAAMTGITASPALAWTTGQYVTLRDKSNANWNGTAWKPGKAV